MAVHHFLYIINMNNEIKFCTIDDFWIFWVTIQLKK